MWTTRSPGVSRSRMSRGTTRRIAFGRRTRTLPNSSRSVTNTRPSGPPVKPPLRLRSTRASAPGGGGVGDRVRDAGGVAGLLEELGEPRRLVRGDDDARRRARRPSPRQRSTASAIRAPRPGGSCGSRQPNRSPDDLPPPAIAPLASDSQVSSSVRAPSSRRFQSRGGRSVGGQSFGSSPAREEVGAPLVGLAPQELRRLAEVARLVEDEQRLGPEVVERGRGREQRRPDLGGVADGRGARFATGAGRSRSRSRSRSSSRCRGAHEPLEVLAEPLRQPPRHRAEPLAQPVGPALGHEELRRREQHHALDLAGRALVGRVEGAQRVDLVAERLDPDRQLRRRREDVDDAAAARELAAARDLEDRRVAELEQRGQQAALADPSADPELQRRLGQVVGRDRVLDQRLDAGDEDPRLPAAPRRQRRDARRRLVGDELAALVGEGRPGLEHRDRSRIADPRRELLGDAIADLRVARDPADPLAGHERERRREVALGAVRHRGDPGVAAGVRRRRGDRSEPLPQRRERARVAEQPRQSREIRQAPARSGPRRRRCPTAGRGLRLRHRSDARLRGRGRGLGNWRQRLLALGEPALPALPAAQRRAAAHSRPPRPLAVGVGRIGRIVAGDLRAQLSPARLRPPDPIRPGRPVDLARRRDPVLVRRPKLERVEPRRGLVRALARPGLDRVRRRVEQLVEALPLVGLELRQDVVDEPVVRRADADAQPAERLGPELADDRAQAVVAARAAATACARSSASSGPRH